MLNKAKTLIASQLAQGISVIGLSRTMAAAVVCGTFPLLGFTTGLSFIAGLVFKLNHPALQLINQLLGIVQLLLIPVYISIAEWLGCMRF